MIKKFYFLFIIFSAAASVGTISAQTKTKKTGTYPKMTAPQQKKRGTILEGLKIEPLKITKPPLREIQIKNGPLILIAEDSSLPFITINMHFTRGTDSELREEAGNLQALVSLLQISGTVKRSAEEIQEQLSRLGALLKIGYTQHSMNAEITFLKRDFDQVTELLLEILTEPGMEQSKLEIIKDSIRTEIRQRNDNPSNIARRKMQEILYYDSRLGYSLTDKDVDRIKTDSLLRELKTRLDPQNLIIGVSGDADAEQITAFAERAVTVMRNFTKDTPYKKPEIYRPGQKENPYKGKIVLVNTDAKQAVIYAGADLPEHSHPDFFAIQTGNYILGSGSFNSRLMREIRAKRGLAYYASSATNFFADYGRFTAASGTRTDKAKETLDLMLSIIRDFSNTVSEEELSLAKDAIINSVVFQFEDPAQYVNGEIRFRVNRMPENYLSLFPDKIRSVTVEQIRKTFRTYLQPENILIVVAGPASMKDELEKIRPVVIVDPETPMH